MGRMRKGMLWVMLWWMDVWNEEDAHTYRCDAMIIVLKRAYVVYVCVRGTGGGMHVVHVCCAGVCGMYSQNVRSPAVCGVVAI